MASPAPTSKGSKPGFKLALVADPVSRPSHSKAFSGRVCFIFSAQRAATPATWGWPTGSAHRSQTTSAFSGDDRHSRSGKVRSRIRKGSNSEPGRVTLAEGGDRDHALDTAGGLAAISKSGLVSRSLSLPAAATRSVGCPKRRRGRAPAKPASRRLHIQAVTFQSARGCQLWREAAIDQPCD